MHRYVGDPQLLAGHSGSFASRDYGEIFSAAFCWNIFGMADGQTNTWNRPSIHLTGFDGAAVIAALDVVLGEVLRPEDRWLIDLPVDIGATRAFEAVAIATPDGRAAIELPIGLFGGLFGANDAYWDAHHGGTADLSVDDLLKDLASVLVEDAEERPVKNSIVTHYMDAYLHGQGNPSWRERRDWVWRMTTLQHVFLLLHEFGHLAQEPPQTFAHQPHTGTEAFERELRADRWAGSYLADKMPFALSSSDANVKHDALFLLFLLMEILRHLGYLPWSIQHISERYRTAKGYLGCSRERVLPAGTSAVASFFALTNSAPAS